MCAACAACAVCGVLCVLRVLRVPCRLCLGASRVCVFIRARRVRLAVLGRADALHRHVRLSRALSKGCAALALPGMSSSRTVPLDREPGGFASVWPRGGGRSAPWPRRRRTPSRFPAHVMVTLASASPGVDGVLETSCAGVGGEGWTGWAAFRLCFFTERG